MSRNPERQRAQCQKSVRRTTKTNDVVCAVLARCDARATKTAAPKPPLKATRVNRSVNRVAVSRKVNGLRKDNKVNKGNKGNESTKGSMPVLDSKTVNIRVVTSHRNLARGRPSVAG